MENIQHRLYSVYELINNNSDNIFQLTVTSLPYDSLRSYTNDVVWNFDKFKEIADLLYRVTKPGGVVVWVVGDSTIKGSESGTSYLSCKETHESSVRGRNCNNPFIWLNIIFNSHIANIGFFSEKPKIFAKKSLI